MNDFERKLAAQPFRTPPADLRRAILAAAPAPRTSWRDWLWPSPLAWGALAAVWALFAALDIVDRPEPGPATMATHPAPADYSTATFLTLHPTRDLRHALEFAN